MIKKILLYIFSFLQSLSGYGQFGSGSVIKYPSKIWNKKYLKIGNDSFVAEGSFFALSDCYMGERYNPSVKIGNDVCIGANFFVASVGSIVIEDNVLMSDRVFISDHIHDYEDVASPIKNQKLKYKGDVLIKEGAFIGINSVISPGVTIGKNSVVGASSVVTKSVPDYCVVAGNPAKIIKRYNSEQEKWQNIKQVNEQPDAK